MSDLDPTTPAPDVLADVAADPSRLEDLDPETLADVGAELERLRLRVLALVNRPPSTNGSKPESGNSEPLIRADAVAEMLGLSTDRVYALAREDLIPHVRAGRSVRFSRQAVEAWKDDGGQALPGGWREEPER